MWLSQTILIFNALHPKEWIWLHHKKSKPSSENFSSIWFNLTEWWWPLDPIRAWQQSATPMFSQMTRLKRFLFHRMEVGDGWLFFPVLCATLYLTVGINMNNKKYLGCYLEGAEIISTTFILAQFRSPNTRVKPEKNRIDKVKFKH